MPTSNPALPQELPSKGFSYDESKISLNTAGTVFITAFLSGETRILENTSDSYQSYVQLLSRLLAEPQPTKIDIDHLLVSDVIFLLYMARLQGTGKEYHTGFTCNACGTAQPVVVDITGFMVKEPEEVPNYRAEGITDVVAGCNVELHLPRLHDEKMISSQMNTLRARKKILNPKTDRNFVRLAQLIDKVDGQPLSPEKKFEWLESIPANEFDYLDELLGDMDTGIRPLIDMNCTECDSPNKLFVGLTPEFFRGTPRRRTQAQDNATPAE